MIVSQFGKQRLLDFFDENCMKVRSEIVNPIVEQLFNIEENNDERKILSRLPDTGHRFAHNLILTENGIGVIRFDSKRQCEAVNRLNVHCLHSLGLANFGWGGEKVVDWYQLAKEKNLPPPPLSAIASKTMGVKATPALSINWFFRWSLAMFECNTTQKEFNITPFVRDHIKRALSRPHSKPLCDGLTRKRETVKKHMVEELKRMQDSSLDSNGTMLSPTSSDELPMLSPMSTSSSPIVQHEWNDSLPRFEASDDDDDDDEQDPFFQTTQCPQKSRKVFYDEDMTDEQFREHIMEVDGLL